MPTIRANDLDIAYEVRGDGPPLVIMHGAATTAGYTFGRQLPAIAGTFQVFMPDARGHGNTRWDVARGFRAEWLVDDLEAFVDVVGLATFHLVGYSMGGMTALGFAARRPERLRTLVVAGITTAREPRASVVRRLMDPARIERDEPGWAADLRRLDETHGAGHWRTLVTAVADDVAAQPLLTPVEIRGITSPTLVMVGDRDPLVPVDQAAALARSVRDGRLFVAPRAGHDVTNEQPELCTTAMLGFYRSTEHAARARAGAAGIDGTTQTEPEEPR
ncbi:MAG: alpha/beta fold hydrolase [Chloroflexota bacterium]